VGGLVLRGEGVANGGGLQRRDGHCAVTTQPLVSTQWNDQCKQAMKVGLHTSCSSDFFEFFWVVCSRGCHQSEEEVHNPGDPPIRRRGGDRPRHPILW
jgi:hypothetical protein